MSTGFIAVIGGANMDLLGKAAGDTTAADSNPGQVSLSPGGVARNIAENLAHLGSHCELIAPLGDDLWGRQLIAQGQAAGIGMSHCLTMAGRRTSTYLSVHDQHGELITAINDMQILDSLNPQALAERLPVLKQATCWILDANLSEEALAFLFEHAESIPVWVDPVSTLKAQKLVPYLAKISCLTPNLQEAALLTDTSYCSEQNASGLTSELAAGLATQLHQRGVEKVMITLGTQGAYASDQQHAYWLDSQATQVKNVTGCGDAAIAALAHANSRGLNWYDSCKLAMSAAALTAASEQTNTPQLKTIVKTIGIPL